MKRFVALAALFLSAPAWAVTVLVEIPKPLLRSDGRPLTAKEYKYVEVLYGPCSAETGIESIRGGTSIDPSRWLGQIRYVPENQTFCLVAVVVGPDRQPMGRSNIGQFSTAPGVKKPRAPTLIWVPL